LRCAAPLSRTTSPSLVAPPAAAAPPSHRRPRAGAGGYGGHHSHGDGRRSIAHHATIMSEDVLANEHLQTHAAALFEAFAMEALQVAPDESPPEERPHEYDEWDDATPIVPESDSDEEIKFGGRLMARAPTFAAAFPLGCARCSPPPGTLLAHLPACDRDAGCPAPASSSHLHPLLPLNCRNEHAGDADH